MKITKRIGALALALALALSALGGCGKKDAPAGSGSGSSAGSSSQSQPMDLAGITDPYAAVAGIDGSAPAAKLGGTEIPAAEVLYWLAINISGYWEQYGGALPQIPWDAEMSSGTTLADQLKEGALEAALFYRGIQLLGSYDNKILQPCRSAGYETGAPPDRGRSFHHGLPRSRARSSSSSRSSNCWRAVWKLSSSSWRPSMWEAKEVSSFRSKQPLSWR